MGMFTIIDVDHTYLEQDFYKERQVQWLKLSDLQGMNGYCGEESEEAVRRRLAGCLPTPLHFLGNGNYHYLSYFLLERQREAFTLVLFDHHSDMQPSLFGDILSCGSWVEQALSHNPCLKQVVMFGVGQDSALGIGEEYKNRVTVIGEEVLMKDIRMERTIEAIKTIRYPIYISLDKDVFAPRVLETNWDQGSMGLEQWEEICRLLARRQSVVGADVCGEYVLEGADFHHMKQASSVNGRANGRILKILEACLDGR